MDMNDRRLGHIGDDSTPALDFLGPSQVFQARQNFVVRLNFPRRTANCTIRIVAEVGCLRTYGGLRKPFRKNLVLGEFIDFVSALFAIAQHHSGIGKRLDQTGEP